MCGFFAAIDQNNWSFMTAALLLCQRVSQCPPFAFSPDLFRQFVIEVCGLWDELSNSCQTPTNDNGGGAQPGRLRHLTQGCAAVLEALSRSPYGSFALTRTSFFTNERNNCVEMLDPLVWTHLAGNWYHMFRSKTVALIW